MKELQQTIAVKDLINAFTPLQWWILAVILILFSVFLGWCLSSVERTAIQKAKEYTDWKTR